MTHGIRHFVWRNGRPRWVPSPAGRAIGFRGRDLKDEDGHWLPIKEAMVAAERLNLMLDQERGGVTRAGRRANTTDDPNNLLPGYVYFIWTEKRVKVGFSTNPFVRLKVLKTSISSPIEQLLILPGSMEAEQKLHRRFAKHRVSGEWFRCNRAMDQTIARMLVAGTTDIL